MAESKILSKETLVPISVVVVIVSLAVSFHLWISSQFNEMNKTLANIDKQMYTIELSMKSIWTADQQKIFELELQKKNPNLSVPDSWNIINKISN